MFRLFRKTVIRHGDTNTGIREKQALVYNDLKDRRGYSHLKEEALHRAMWRARFRRGFGPVVRQTAE
jgi:hypothetical protein